jgi:hypothetical protein
LFTFSAQQSIPITNPPKKKNIKTNNSHLFPKRTTAIVLPVNGFTKIT